MQPRFPEDPNYASFVRAQEEARRRAAEDRGNTARPFTQKGMVDDLLTQTQLVTPEQAASLERAVLHGEIIA